LSLQRLLTPATVQAILQAIWERGQASRQAMPDATHEPSWNANTSQLDTAGLTLLMLAHYFARKRCGDDTWRHGPVL
jgi:hypothetical protein